MARKDDIPEKTRAVALSYDMGKEPAPKIVAKGEGSIAEQILKVAAENNIPIRTDADLVEILAVLELDSFIPLEAYTAVAEILRYIYQQNTAKG